MTISLTGKYNSNETNLSGKSFTNNQPISFKIKNIKERILQDFLIPLFAKQWNILKENIYFLNEIQKKIVYYYNIYKLDELLVYIQLLKVFNILIEKYKLLEDIEDKNNGKRDKNEIISMVFRTSMIQLLPEYEIYNNILGKPKRELNQKYRDEIIHDIKRMLVQENTSYQKIKDYICCTYKQE